MQKNRTIICLTASYPFGKRETYFENELQYLAKVFDRIIIVPKYNPYKEDAYRNIPDNVEIVPPILSMNKVKRFFEGVFSSGPVEFFIDDFFKSKVYSSFRYSKSWFQTLLMHRIIYRQFKKILNKEEDDIWVYSYWADSPIMATTLLKKCRKIVRMHRWDFYVEEHHGYLPVREQIYQSSDLLLPISMDIKDRLIKDYKISPDKIHLSYLGVASIQSRDEVFSKKDDGVLRIVSCSRVDPIKKVDLIADAVLMLGDEQKVEWHHFGDGIDFSNLKEKIEKTPDHISIHLHGWAEQEEISRFYKQHYITWFVNVSRHEGVPVSIMEAISFAIPAIATDVGATRELINDTNGFLVRENITANELTRLLNSHKEPEYANKRERAYETWEDKFNADKNYKILVKRLLNV